MVQGKSKNQQRLPAKTPTPTVQVSTSSASQRRTRNELPPYIITINSRDKEYFYFTPDQRDKSFKRIAMRSTPADEAFWQLYDELVEAYGLQNTTLADVAISPGTVAALVAEYKRSTHFQKRSAITRRDYARIMSSIVADFGATRVVDLKRTDVISKHDAIGATRPASANAYVRVFSLLFTHALNSKSFRGVEYNPCAKIKKYEIGEYEPWPWAAVMFAKKHMRPYMWWAVALAVYTGQRQSDCLRMGWPEVGADKIGVVLHAEQDTDDEDDLDVNMSADDALRLICEETGVASDLSDFQQDKTRKRLWIPIHRDLREVLDAIKSSDRQAKTILTNQSGVPWQSGFQASWRKELLRKELKPLHALKLKFHGLRKTATIKLLEAGCTDAETAAITGHSRQMLEHYAKRVNQKDHARSAINKWERVA
jgi:integrase